MTVEYLPVGISCNISCSYCYQDPMREAGNINVKRDWNKVRDQLDRLGSDFSVFGGEPLLAPISHLDEVFEYGYKKFGKNGIQTNGSLITDEHIKLFTKYNVQVGISIDGPGKLNNTRCNSELTEKTLNAIARLCDLNHYPSLITTIHKGNSDLSVLIPWFEALRDMGVRYLNLHELEVECGNENLALSEDENIRVYLELYEWSKLCRMTVMPFCDIKAMLTEMHPNVTCTWNACDPLTTPAVQGISPSGDMSNCGRTNKDGVNWIKGDTQGHERYIALYHTPQEYGGCKDCKYFAFCKGHCPGTAIEGDWRNRTVNCRFWYSLFEQIENDLVKSNVKILTPCDKKELERRLFATWQNHQDVPHGDAHGDSPHGDDHGDHTDIPVVFLDKRPSDAG
jgi:uncharacterized protein